MGDMHVDAKLVNPRPSTGHVWTSNPWTGPVMVEVPTTTFDVVTRDGEEMPALGDGDSFSITWTYTAE